MMTIDKTTTTDANAGLQKLKKKEQVGHRQCSVAHLDFVEFIQAHLFLELFGRDTAYVFIIHSFTSFVKVHSRNLLFDVFKLFSFSNICPSYD